MPRHLTAIVLFCGSNSGHGLSDDRAAAPCRESGAYSDGALWKQPDNRLWPTLERGNDGDPFGPAGLSSTVNMPEAVISAIGFAPVFALFDRGVDCLFRRIDSMGVRQHVERQMIWNDDNTVGVTADDIASHDPNRLAALARQRHRLADLDDRPQGLSASRRDEARDAGQIHLVDLIAVTNAAIGDEARVIPP